MNHHKHFTISERKCLITMHFELDYSMRKIAKALKKDPSSVSREFKRLKECNFNPELAQEDYENKRKNSRKPHKINKTIKDTIITYFKLTWSPEQICARALSGELSHKTIYNYFKSGVFESKYKVHLRRNGKKLHKYETRGKLNIGKTIHERSEAINDRTEFSHWEGDTIVSTRGDKACFLTLVERVSRYAVTIKSDYLTSASINEAFGNFCLSIPKHALKSVTFDRGSEFAGYRELESKHGIDIYFADPRSPGQRGTNENFNGNLREFFPKKTKLSDIDENVLARKLWLINNRPKKCLGWLTPQEFFFTQSLLQLKLQFDHAKNYLVSGLLAEKNFVK